MTCLRRGRKSCDALSTLDPSDHSVYFLAKEQIKDRNLKRNFFRGEKLLIPPKSSLNYRYLLLLVLLGLLTRLPFLNTPHFVVFDEVYFGKHAASYLTGRFFFDLHPPLGKLIFALVGYLNNFDGNYEFNSIGDDYLNVPTTPAPYAQMRFIPALLGSLTVPLVYLLTNELGGGTLASFFAATLLLLDNSFVCVSRFILLDSFLIFFILMAVFTYIRFRQQSKSPFSRKWWAYLFACGSFLALSVGVKMVGFFAMAFVGVHTVGELWALFCDSTIPLRVILRHFLIRTLALIVLPSVFIYLILSVHLRLLPLSGDDAMMSRSFQSDLLGNQHNISTWFQPEKIAYGSIISLRMEESQCYLHSHPNRWPVHVSRGSFHQITSGQQQVTCYKQVDDNNLWYVAKGDADLLNEGPVIVRGNGEQDDDVTLVRDGDIIQLFHVITRGVLHTHDVSSVVTPSKQEMSVCHAHDRWKEGTRFQVFFYGFREYWKPFETLVKLVNVGDIPTTVQLTGHVLPDFALRQYEVVSARDTEGLMELWQAEHHEHHKLRAVKRASLPKLSTFSKIIENLQAMFMANTKLVGEHHYSTRPQRWPFLPKGISFFQDPRPDHRKQIYMLGNVACWWLTHGLLVAFLALWTWYTLRLVRNHVDISPNKYRVLHCAMVYAGLAYALHYLPFFFMNRTLFLHHYLPAMAFAYVISGITAEYLYWLFYAKLKPSLARGFVALSLFSALVIFAMFAPMTYGLESPRWERYLVWRRGWNFLVYQK